MNFLCTVLKSLLNIHGQFLFNYYNYFFAIYLKLDTSARQCLYCKFGPDFILFFIVTLFPKGYFPKV